MKSKKVRLGILLALLALVVASAVILLIPNSKDGFKFLNHTKPVSYYEAIMPSPGGIFFTSVDTYRSELSVDYLGQMAEKELIVKLWQKGPGSSATNSRSFTLMPKTILITTVLGETNIYIFESRPANYIDRARAWFKGLWKKGKK